jgi:hypothetical protein
MALIRQVLEVHSLPDAPLCLVKVEAAEIISRRGLSDHVGPDDEYRVTDAHGRRRGQSHVSADRASGGS